MSTTQIKDDITGLGGEVCREATERVWDVSRALRAHLSNFTPGGLRDYIALSRHQLELTEFVTERTLHLLCKSIESTKHKGDSLSDNA